MRCGRVRAERSAARYERPPASRSEPEDEEAHALAERDDAEQRTDDPRDLEARLERANARPRTASGPSRWSRLSNPTRPAADAVATAMRGERGATDTAARQRTEQHEHATTRAGR